MRAEWMFCTIAGLTQEQACALAELFGGQHSLLGKPKRACIADLIAFLVHRSQDLRLWPQLCTVGHACHRTLHLVTQHVYPLVTHNSAWHRLPWRRRQRVVCHNDPATLRVAAGVGCGRCGRCARRGGCGACRHLRTSWRWPSPAWAASPCAPGERGLSAPCAATNPHCAPFIQMLSAAPLCQHHYKTFTVTAFEEVEPGRLCWSCSEALSDKLAEM